MTNPQPYRPDVAFAALFSAFTGGGKDAIGTQLAELMNKQSSDDPLLVSTASDIGLFPGGGKPAVIESFRKHTKGFIELTAVSHVPLAICYVARMRELQPQDEKWRGQLQLLIDHANRVRQSNTVEMWRDRVALQAFAGAEPKLVDMIEYTLSTSIDYMTRALQAPELLNFEILCKQYIDAKPDTLPVSMNAVMFATFGLAYVDVGYRIGGWLREQQIDWDKVMILVSGQSGRPTAGVSWQSNNMCNLIWKSSDERLSPDRLFVAPNAPGFSVENLPDAEGLKTLEHTYRHIWCNTRASIDLSRKMFEGYAAFHFNPQVQAMAPIKSLDDHAACVARLRRIMEDPQQLLSNCVADYILDELRRCNYHPQDVHIPGFTNVEYPKR